MAKKKQSKQKYKAFQNDPFRELKGFAVSDSAPEPTPESEPEKQPSPEPFGEDLFAREMNMLGVKPVDGRELPGEDSPGMAPGSTAAEEPLSDEEQFLAALGEMTVRFEDQVPVKTDTRHAAPRRMKLLKQGRLKPEATLDLHGLFRHQVVDKVRFFLQDACHQGCRTVLIVTGRGLHSNGEPVLRSEVERFLQSDGRRLIAEWARAPRQYGGAGALVVFLKGCPDVQ